MEDFLGKHKSNELVLKLLSIGTFTAQLGSKVENEHELRIASHLAKESIEGSDRLKSLLVFARPGTVCDCLLECLNRVSLLTFLLF